MEKRSNLHHATKWPRATNSGAIKFCVPLAGFEPATYLPVRELLYPLSYSGTRAEGIHLTQSKISKVTKLWITQDIKL